MKPIVLLVLCGGIAALPAQESAPAALRAFPDTGITVPLPAEWTELPSAMLGLMKRMMARRAGAGALQKLLLKAILVRGEPAQVDVMKGPTMMVGVLPDIRTPEAVGTAGRLFANSAKDKVSGTLSEFVSDAGDLSASFEETIRGMSVAGTLKAADGTPLQMVAFAMPTKTQTVLFWVLAPSSAGAAVIDEVRKALGAAQVAAGLAWTEQDVGQLRSIAPNIFAAAGRSQIESRMKKAEAAGNRKQYEEASSEYGKVAVMCREVIEKKEGVPDEWQRRLCFALAKQADMLFKTEDWKRAGQPLKEALNLTAAARPRRETERDWWEVRKNVLEQQSAFLRRGDKAGAVAFRPQLIETLMEGYEKKYGSAWLPRLISARHKEQAYDLRDLKRHDAAVAAAQEALTWVRRAQEEAAGDASYTAELGSDLRCISNCLNSAGKFADALEAIKQSIAAYEQARAARPNEIGWANDMINSLRDCGTLLAAHHELGTAAEELAVWDKALAAIDWASNHGGLKKEHADDAEKCRRAVTIARKRSDAAVPSKPR